MCISEKEIYKNPPRNLDTTCQLSPCLLLRAPGNRLGHHPTDTASHLFLVDVGNSSTPSDPFSVASFVCGAPAFLSAT